MKDLFLLLGISKQAYSQALNRAKVLGQKEHLYINWIHEIREIHPGMGLRKMYEQFQPEGIGRDAFISLGLKEGFRLRSIVNPVRTTKSIKSNRYFNLLGGKRFTGVNQIWSSDIFYFPFKGAHNYVVLIMDVYSRRIIGYNIADNMRAENNVKALQMALSLRGVSDYKKQLIHHSDRGSQYIADLYTGLLDDYNIEISMCNDVLENAHMERANGTIKNEYLNRWEIKNEKELGRKLKAACEGYNNRAHKSLSRKTPIEFEIELKETPENKRVILEVFTVKKSNQHLNQISLFPGL
jgi:putative transposase